MNGSGQTAAKRTTIPTRDGKVPALTIVMMGCALVAGIALSCSPVRNERNRLSAGCAAWEYGDLTRNPGNPPLADLVVAVPVCLLADSSETKELVSRRTMPKRLQEFVCTGRLTQLLWQLLAAWICYRWAKELFGDLPGLGVLTLWCLDPMILAHAALITGDMCAAALGLAGTYAFWKWMQRPSIPGAAVSGLTLGFVLLSKYVWIVMPLIWSLMWIARPVVQPRPQRWPLPGHLTIMALLSLYVVNAGYAFESTCQPWRDFQFRSPALQSLAVDPRTASGLWSWLGSIPVPVPRNYVMGIDAVTSHLETDSFSTWLRGQFHAGNVWWFHMYGLLVKMPLGTWLLLFLALYARLTATGVSPTESERGGPEPAPGPSADLTESERNTPGPGLIPARHGFTDLVLWLPAITILVFVSWATQIKLLRYILPMLPFVFIWTGHAFVWAQHGHWWRKTLVSGALAWSVLSSLWVYPHSLSYFNEAAGGSANGHAHLIWASYDWGQDLLFLKDWADQHPEAQPLYVNCYAAVPLDVAGISGQPAPNNGPQPGWYAVSASVLRGIRRIRNPGSATANSPDHYLESFRDLEPKDRVAYSIFIYHLDCRQANAMRASLGLELLDCSQHPQLRTTEPR